MGKLKDEYGGKVVTQFSGLHSKIYSNTIEGEKEKKQGKGIKKKVIKST